jgi:hypothetical protein
VVSCGVRLSAVELSEIRKLQVVGSIPVAGAILFSCLAWRLLFIRNQGREWRRAISLKESVNMVSRQRNSSRLIHHQRAYVAMVSSPSSRETSHVARSSFHASRVSASPIHEISRIFSRDFASHEISALADFPSLDSMPLNLYRLVRFHRAGIDVAVGTRHRVIHSQQGAA